MHEKVLRRMLQSRLFAQSLEAPRSGSTLKFTATDKSLFQSQHRCIKASAAAQQSRFAIDELLDRDWLLPSPAAPVKHVNELQAKFSVLRDDLTHPYIGGNKRRKLDAIFPTLINKGVKDVISCGGSQSAHILAVSAAAAESGFMRAHLLVRGERPQIPTGNHLFAKMYAYHVKYVPRSDYADRTAMFKDYVDRHHLDLKTTAIIPEGGAEVAALLGQIRLVDWLAKTTLPADEECTLVIDSGTGTSAIGLSLACALLGLNWKVLSVMLAGPIAYYEQQTAALTSAFVAEHGLNGAASVEALTQQVTERLFWVDRFIPRKFGKILPGEVEKTKLIAREHGILVDPIWTLSSWELAEHQGRDKRNVMMIHTGGGLGLCGLAQRWPEEF